MADESTRESTRFIPAHVMEHNRQLSERDRLQWEEREREKKRKKTIDARPALWHKAGESANA